MTETGTIDLCYLDAHNVHSPAGSLAGLDLCSQDDEKLGTIEGVLIDPVARRIRYFVVGSAGWLRKRHYLMSADEPTHVEPDMKTLRVEVDADDVAREEFDTDSVRRFTPDDAITAIFASNAA